MVVWGREGVGRGRGCGGLAVIMRNGCGDGQFGLGGATDEPQMEPLLLVEEEELVCGSSGRRCGGVGRWGRGGQRGGGPSA